MYEFEKHTKLTEFIQEMANTGKVPREWSSFIETLNLALGKTNVRRSLPITNQKLWEMAKEITDKLRNAKTMPTDKVDWDLCQELWFDWLEGELFGNES